MNLFRLLVLLWVLLIVTFTNIAQPAIVISVVLPPDMARVDNRTLFDDFKSQYPHVEIVIVDNPLHGGMINGFPAQNLDHYLHQARQIAEMADIFFLDGMSIHPAMTISNTLLDMKPMLNADPELSDYFYPAILDSFQWDGGLWALPYRTYPIVLTYDPDAFDAIGLAYPDLTWGLDDFVHAVEMLTERDANNQVIRPGFYLPGMPVADVMLLRALSGVGFYDEQTLPAMPHFDQPEIIHVLETLYRLREQGDLFEVNLNDFMNDFAAMQSIADRLSTVPLKIQANLLESNNYRHAPLPNGEVGLIGSGIAISGGTAYPEIAYQVAKYLATKPDLLGMTTATVPVSPAEIAYLAEAESPFALFERTDDQQMIIDLAIHNGLSFSADARYWDYVFLNPPTLPIQDSIQVTQSQALNDFQTATSVMNRPVLNSIAPHLYDGSTENVLKLGIRSSNLHLDNIMEWRQFLDGFTAQNHNDLDLVELDIFYAVSDEVMQTYDCIISDSRNVLSQTNPLDLYPLLLADQAYYAEDFVTGSLNLLTVDGKLIGYPLALDPSILLYNSEHPIFQDYSRDNLDIPLWDERLTLDVRMNRASDLIQLLVSYGAILIDYRVPDPIPNFNSVEMEEAIEQIMRLVNQQRLTITEGHVNMRQSDAVAVAVTLDREIKPFLEYQPRYNVRPFPSLELHQPLSYELWMGAISEHTLATDACYRLFKAVSSNYTLLGTMPTQYSLINDLIRDSPESPFAQFYETYRDRLSSAPVIVPYDNQQVGSLHQAILGYLDGQGQLDIILDELQHQIP